VGVIVVGVDGSDGSKTALRWAAEEARLRDAELRVVHVFHSESAWRDLAVAEGMTGEQFARVQERLREQDREQAQELVAAAVREIEDGVNVQSVVLHDHHPAQALVEQAEGADLLVVGSRGRGGFAGLVLGSVSQQCLYHARCPVVVVRPEG
jgi:nucleotide-binding universal stress UspA family protein